MLGFSGCGRIIMLVLNSPENPIITTLSWTRAWAQLSLPGAGGTPALPSHPIPTGQPVLVRPVRAVRDSYYVSKVFHELERGECQ